MDQRKDTQRTGADDSDMVDARTQAQEQIAPDVADQSDNADDVPMDKQPGAMPAP